MLAEVLFGILFFLVPIVGMAVVMIAKCVRKDAQYAYEDGESVFAEKHVLKRPLEGIRYPSILEYQLIECQKAKELVLHPHIKSKGRCREGPLF